MINAAAAKRELKKFANPASAKILQSFFKTGPGQYGEGDVFIGVTNPQVRAVAKKFAELPLSHVKVLLDSKIHEERALGLFVLTGQYTKGSDAVRARIFAFYLKNRSRVNNWDLVDLSAPNIVGSHLLDRDWSRLLKLAQSKNLWDRRIAIVGTLAFIRQKNFTPTLHVVKLLLKDEQDLIHKASGWMLREVGKQDVAVLEKFLRAHYRTMPRTMLRYAIERFPTAKRNFYLGRPA